MLGAHGERPGEPGQPAGQLAAQHVGGADELGDERRGRTQVEVARGVDLLDAALAEHRHPVRHRERLALVVGDEHEGDAQLALQFLQLALHLLAQLQVQRAQRLVQQQHPRPVDQRPGQRHALALAAGELRRLACAVAGQGHQRQGLLGARQALGPGDALDLQAVGDVVQHAHVGEQRVVLEHRVDVALVGRQAGGLRPVDADGAGRRLLEAGDQPQAGGLARAGRPEHGEELAFADVDGHPVDGGDLAETAGHLGKLHGEGHFDRLVTKRQSPAARPRGPMFRPGRRPPAPWGRRSAATRSARQARSPCGSVPGARAAPYRPGRG